MLCLVLHVRRRLREIPTTTLAAGSAPPLQSRHKIAVAAMLSIAAMGLVWWTFSSAHAPRFCPYNFICCSISAGAAVALTYALAWQAYRWRVRHRYRQ
jgi:hypothetical protein